MTRARGRCARRWRARDRGPARPSRPGRAAGTRGRRCAASRRNAEARIPDFENRDACRAAARRRCTRPVGVYLIALETRFCSRRRSSRRSERTVSEEGTNRECRGPCSRAMGSNSRCSWRNISSMRKLDHCGFMAPVSRREMSRSAVRISSTASSDASMFSASVASPASLSRSTSEVA